MSAPGWNPVTREDRASDEGPPLSPVARVGPFVVTSGQVPYVTGVRATGDFKGQLRIMFDNLKATLALTGCTLEDVFKVNAFLEELQNVAAYNEVYREYFQPPYPVRTTIGASLIEASCEIEAWACAGDTGSAEGH
jgi:2-iminobutanoate/2-iminopropanoate deaminase